MSQPVLLDVQGAVGKVVVHHWPNEDTTYVAVISHGIAEHARRYDHVAAALLESGAAVYAPDHQGHGLSEGERTLIEDGPALTADLHKVVELARERHPGLPLVMIGHSMGGLIAARYAQQHAEELAALVLSGPAVGGNPAFKMLLEMDPIPEVPIDPAILSRDPAVGEAYAADPLVYSGPLRRPTLESLFKAIEVIAQEPGFEELPVLWLHGGDDALVPLDVTRAAMEHLRGPGTEEKVYPGARHEIFNETNRDEVIGDALAFIERALAR